MKLEVYFPSPGAGATFEDLQIHSWRDLFPWQSLGFLATLGWATAPHCPLWEWGIQEVVGKCPLLAEVSKIFLPYL